MMMGLGHIVGYFMVSNSEIGLLPEEQAVGDHVAILSSSRISGKTGSQITFAIKRELLFS